MDHPYAPGRYTLVASVDGLSSDRSISVIVEVSPARERRSPPASRFEFFGFSPNQLQVGGSGFIFLPFEEPPGVTLFGFDGECQPTDDILEPSGPIELFPPTHVALPFVTTGPGTCTVFIYGEDANGPFVESSTLTIN
jgi:hypothetical protein